MQKRRQYSELPDIELSPALDQKIRAMTRVADRDVAELQAKARIHSLVLSFLGSRPGLRDYAREFARRWDRLSVFSVESLATDLGRSSEYVQPLAFARASAASPAAERSADDRVDPIVAIVSLTSWAVLTDKVSEKAIAREARSRGIPSLVAIAVSRHLAANLIGSTKEKPGTRRSWWLWG